MIKALAFCSFFLLISCQTVHSPESQAKFESAHSLLLEGQIHKGTIYSETAHRPTLESEIVEQLYYMRGFLMERHGNANNPYFKVGITDVEDLGGGIFLAKYKASFQVAWPEEIAVPETMDLIVPRFGNEHGRQKFYERYVENCRSPMKPAKDIKSRYYWYYYETKRPNCSIANELEDTSLGSPIRLAMTLRPSPDQSSNRYPEYAKIWEDQTLIMTIIRGMSSHSQPLPKSDSGASGFNEDIRKKILKYGLPKSSNLPVTDAVFDYARQSPFIHMRWDDVADHVGRNLEVNYFFVEEISLLSAEQKSTINEKITRSDVVIYSGHSGLGGNILNFSNLGTFAKGQYQVYVLNGCVTYTYQDHTLFNRHGAVNNPSRPTKYLDVISNAKPAYFNELGVADDAIVAGFLEGHSYRDILTKFPKRQRANVIGEDDNENPQHFTEDLPEFSPCNPKWGGITTCLNFEENSHCGVGSICAKKACKAGKILNCPEQCVASQFGADDLCQ